MCPAFPTFPNSLEALRDSHGTSATLFLYCHAVTGTLLNLGTMKQSSDSSRCMFPAKKVSGDSMASKSPHTTSAGMI